MPPPQHTIPPQPKDIRNGDIGKVSHDIEISREALAMVVRSAGSVGATITSGASFFRVVMVKTADLTLTTIGSEELPGGHAPVTFWREEETGRSDGTVLLAIDAGQRVHVTVALKVQENQVLPGTVQGLLTLKGLSVAAIPLTGVYVGVDPRTPIGQRWRLMGGEAFFGIPQNNEHRDDTGPGMEQDFTHGALYQASGRGVIYFTPAAFAKWKLCNLPGDPDGIGLPLEDTLFRSDGNQVQRFQFGDIVVRAGNALVIKGEIYAAFAKFPGDLANPQFQPMPALPFEDDAEIVDGRSQRFDVSDFFWTPSTGAHEVHGEIRKHWMAVGGAGSAGFLGLPITDEIATPGHTGSFNRFQGGMIYFSPATGAREVHGAILTRWSALGFEQSHLGFPVSDEQAWTNPANGRQGRISFFQRGQIGWTSLDGALELPPETITLQQQILTPPGTALGGWTAVVLRSDGTYTFSGHLHDSGLDPYSFSVRTVVSAPSGVRFVGQHSGHTTGSVGAGSSNDDWTENGFSDWVRGNWPEVRGATMTVSKSYDDTGVVTGIVTAVTDALSFLVQDVLLGPELAVILTIGTELAAITGGTFGGPGLIPGIAVAGGVVWVFGPSAWLAATVAGVAAGAVTDALIKHRPISDDEYAFANQVFQGTLPPAGRITLTNLAGQDNRQFTIPNIDGSILVNLADAFDVGPRLFKNDSYPKEGQVLIHELTHAWQIHHRSFLPGVVCEGAFGDHSSVAYHYPSPGPAWADFGLEQQGAIVDQWFGGTRSEQDGHPASNGPQMDPQDLYFGYIVHNIRQGQA